MKPSRRVAGILAGGSGDRFWPLSGGECPKQLVHFLPDRPSMLEGAIAQLLPVVGSNGLLIITSHTLHEPIARANLPVELANILAEPAKRDTGPSVAYLAAVILAQAPERTPHEVTICVITSDHIVDSDDLLRADIVRAMDEAERTGALICVGIPPSRPETGFGYIEVAGTESPQSASRAVARFHEKPDHARAKEYVAGGRHFWNSGMLFCRADVLLAEMDETCTELGAAARSMQAALARGDDAAVRATYEDLATQSIDYAVLERSTNVRMIEARFRWENMNAWDALGALAPPDANGNVIIGDAIVIDTSDSVIYNARPGGEAPVAVVGGRGLVVVSTATGVLVVPRERAQEVRQVAAEARELRKR